MGQEHLKEIIDKELNGLEINKVHKQKIIHRCTHSRNTKINQSYKVAVLLLAGILMMNILNSKEVLAAIKNLFTYSILRNQVVPLENALYQLEVPITINTDKGYIKVEGCEVRRGTIEFQLVSNMDCAYGDWEESIKIRDEYGKEYSLIYQNVTSMGTSERKEKTWTIDGIGTVDGLLTQFIMSTPFGDIPIRCTLAQEFNRIEDIGTSAYDKEIYVVARKEQEGSKTSVILNAFDKTFKPIEATFDMRAYNLEGKEIELDFGSNGKYYYDISIDELTKIEVLSVNKVISTREEFIFEAPTEKNKKYNKQLKIGDYALNLLEGGIEEDIQLKMKVEGLKNDERCDYIACEFEYEEYNGYREDIEGEYHIITLNDKKVTNPIKMKIREIHISKEGNWCIIF